LAVTSEGKVICWGDYESGQCTVPKHLVVGGTVILL
jgi:hypothetical protein